MADRVASRFTMVPITVRVLVAVLVANLDLLVLNRVLDRDHQHHGPSCCGRVLQQPPIF